MNETNTFVPNKITKEDIDWVTDLLSFLPRNAFTGYDMNDYRPNVLKSMDTMDVAACPGSGKTTLLVAKLAILAKKWKYQTRGICVLSHTNTARHEIEHRLGNTAVGRRLLSYPHFIGTIHGFVNEFLAVPWLRSLGFPIKIIDTEISLKKRWNDLSYNRKYALEKVNHNHLILSYKFPDFSLGDVRWTRKSNLGSETDTYRDIQNVCKKSANEGCFCFDEMFIWAEELLNKNVGIVKIIRDRFPILFIDEAQDNSEKQSEILHRIFIDGDEPVIRQRFGDENQAIYDFWGAEGATTDAFPNRMITRSLNHSLRFGKKVADLTDPLGIKPYKMEGIGPKKPLAQKTKEAEHTIFLFSNSNAGKVLEAYAELLLSTFSKQELENGIFTAIGQVHRSDDDEKETHFPKHVGHYFPDYIPELTKKEPKPNSIVQCILAGQSKLLATGEVYPAIEQIAEGILRLIGMINSENFFQRTNHKHRFILQLLEKNPDVQSRYKELISKFTVDREPLKQEIWETKWKKNVQDIVAAISGKSLSYDKDAKKFVEWVDRAQALTHLSSDRKSRDNLFRFSENEKEVAIKIGSIHSVKGETHTATLVLETYNRAHNLEKILKWLDGGKIGGDGKQDKRLKVHYVGMTRPTHLLCLAMKRSVIEDTDGKLIQKKIQRLEQRGWRVKLI